MPCWLSVEEMRLQATQLLSLDITGCAMLRVVQVSGLERPVSQLQQLAQPCKVTMLHRHY